MKVFNEMVKESQETRVAKGSLVVCINRGVVEMKRDFFLAHMLKLCKENYLCL